MHKFGVTPPAIKEFRFQCLEDILCPTDIIRKVNPDICSVSVKAVVDNVARIINIVAHPFLGASLVAFFINITHQTTINDKILMSRNIFWSVHSWNNMWGCNVSKRIRDSYIPVCDCCSSLTAYCNGVYTKTSVNPEFLKSSSSVYTVSALVISCSDVMPGDTVLTVSYRVCCSS